MVFYENLINYFSETQPYSLTWDISFIDTHWHDSVELLYYTSGCAAVSLNGTTYIARAGDLVIVGSKVVHKIEEIDGLAEHYCLLVDNSFLSTNKLCSSNTNFEPIVRSEKIQAIFSQMIEEQKTNDSFSNMSIFSLVISLFVNLLRDHTTTNLGNSFSTNDNKIILTRKILDYIHENYTSPISIEKIVAHIHFSRSYISHTFKEVTGDSIIHYINVLRCKHAQALLDKNMRVADVAIESGFSDISYFTRIYKQIIGVLPSHHKKNPHAASK